MTKKKLPLSNRLQWLISQYYIKKSITMMANDVN